MNSAVLNIERGQRRWDTRRDMTVINALRQDDRKIRIAAYARVSSDSADQKNSFISQVRYYTQIIREKDDWECVDIYADEGLTGLSSETRPEFQRMMADCRGGKIDHILVKSISRLSRNFTDCICSIRELHMLGVTVYFEKENIDTAKMGDELLLTIQSFFAQRESMSISGNMRRSTRMRMKNGTYLPSSTPYGYTLNLDARILEVNDEQAGVVRSIFDAYLSGRGMRDIAEELNRRNIPKRYGRNHWHHAAIFYILTNINYTGDAIWQKSFSTDSVPFKKVINTGQKTRYLVQNNHPAIISHEDYYNVQALMSERREKHSGKPSEIYTLTEKVICGSCGRRHRRKVTRGKIYWVCRNHDDGKARCPVPQIPESELYQAFARMWNKLYHHRQDIITPMLEQYQAMVERLYRQNDRIGQVNKELQDLSEQAHVLRRLNNKGYIESALYFEQMRELNEKTKELRELKLSLMQRGETGRSINAIKGLVSILESGPEWVDDMDDMLFNEIVDKVIVISAEQVKIRFRCGLELIENIERAAR